MIKLRIFIFLFCILFELKPVYAQVFDEDSFDNQPVSQKSDNSDELLFDDVFSDFPEEEKDISKIKNLDQAIKLTADAFKNKATSQDEPSLEPQEELPPIDGELTLGITKGSFKIYKDIQNVTACSFSVTMHSTLNRDIKTIGLNIVYPKRTFAFVFRNMSYDSYQKHVIRTRGDICYNLSGTPDIRLHTCKLFGASTSECVSRIKWVEKMEDLAPQKSFR